MVESASFKHPVVDLDEFERRLRGPDPLVRGKEDPLAELARLVNGDGRQASADPLASVFAKAPQRPVPAPENSGASIVKLPRAAWDRVEPGFASNAPAPADAQHLQEALRGSIHGDETQAQFEREMRDMNSEYDPVTRSRTQGAMRAVNDDHPLVSAEAGGHAGLEAQYHPEATDIRSSGNVAEAEDHGPDTDWQEMVAPEASIATLPTRQKRTPLFIMGAIGLVGLATIGGTFAFKTGNASAAKNIAVIKAQEGPVKVASDTGDGQTVANQDASILDKAKVSVKGDVGATAKIVAKEEQPIDLNTVPKSLPVPQPSLPVVKAIAPPQPEISSENPFGPPKKVKTVAIRPDGSVISGGSTADALPAPAPDPIARVSVASPPAPVPVIRPAAALAGTTAPALAPTATPAVKPKATVRVVSSPKADSKTVSPALASTADDPNGPLQLAGSGAKVAPARVKVADATPTATNRDSGGGSFSVQLAAPSDPQEAKDASARLQKQFAGELDGHTPSIRAGDNAGRTVYRVRVGGLSREQANAMCTKLKASGGNCFVAGN